jgi:hypothetical protein
MHACQIRITIELRIIIPGETALIKTVIRIRNDMVMVFDERGEQLPEYQGHYQEVRGKILADAPTGSVFNHWFGYSPEPQKVNGEDW